MKKEQGKMPELFLHILWFFNPKNWREYPLQFVALVLFLLLVRGLPPPLTQALRIIRSQFSTVTVRVINFNHITGETTLEFNNKLPTAVPVEYVYVTVAPTNTAPVKPLPDEFQKLVSVFDTASMLVPSGAAIELGPTIDNKEPKSRLIRMAVLLAHETPPLLLPPGLTVTNMSSKGNAFATICEHFASGAELEIELHTSLADIKGRSRLKNIRLGTYLVGEHHVSLINTPNPKDVDILRGGKISGNSGGRMVFTFSGRMRLPPIDDKISFALIVNSSPQDMLITLGQEIESQVPVFLVKNSITYACRFSVALQEGEKLSPDFSSWVLSRDGGKTVMNVPMAFSNSWSDIPSCPSPGNEYAIPLSTNDWQLLINGERWARILEGEVKYTVAQKAWFKLLEADEVTTSLLSSNYNTIALQEVDNDSSWLPVTSASVVPTNSNTALIVQNEVLPDLSVLSGMRLSDAVMNDSSAKEAAKAEQ